MPWLPLGFHFHQKVLISQWPYEDQAMKQNGIKSRDD